MSTISTNICISYGGIHDPFQFDLRVVVLTMISNHHITCCSRNIRTYNLITTLLVPTCAVIVYTFIVVRNKTETLIILPSSDQSIYVCL
jgi:hypothetical protein